ncbi:ECF-type sigma factor [Methylibium rhizosphaerae]|uniref:ECF-type sigma factor n=1 Tax=Methylibium rhizosphaerae TaxID=2570323 RepID=UPI0011280340|nr:ECF-type sigma factor [Methylibium rhizosphaerae]
MSEHGEVTTLLNAAQGGDAGALDRLFALLYPDLRRIAHAKMLQTDERVVLNTTSLVHECYLRLLKLERLGAQDRAHFLAYAARAMRSVVVDIARERQALRRGGDQVFVTLNTAAEKTPAGEDDVLLVHEALQELAELDLRLVQVVEMRYFVGLDNGDIADALGVSTRTVERDWERARSFLYAALKQR